MALIDKLLERLLTRGSITLEIGSAPARTFGPGRGKHLTVGV
jgi:hypothetical protein